MREAHSPFIELRSGSAHDPDGTRLSAILTAYLDAEHAHMFRRLLLRRLAVIAGLAILAELLTRAASAPAFAGALAILFGTALVGPVVEWRAERKLMRMLDEETHRRSGEYW